MTPKVLVTSGDSFSNCLWDLHGDIYNRTWPIWLKDHWPGIEHWSEGLGGQGNQLIAHRLQYRVEQVLKVYRPQDIVVGVMWTGRDRWEIFRRQTMHVPAVNGEEGHPVKFISNADGQWIMFHPQYLHHLNEMFYRQLYDSIWMQINTLNAVLNTQRYLREKGIRYFMSTSFDACFDQNLRHDPNVEWLWDQIDFTTWLPVTSMQDWCKENCPIPGVNNFHPRSEQCEQFVAQVLWPFVQTHTICRQ